MIDDTMRHPKRATFVCVHNRGRDNYEVALALEEAGLLEALVTDFYVPDWLRPALPGSLGRRRREGLSAARVRSSMVAAAVQYVGTLLRLPMSKVFERSDRVLARAAVTMAQRRGAALYAYASYLDGRPTLAPGQPVIDFEYHPHPVLSLEILAADYARNPQVSWSYEREQRIAATAALSNAWHIADAVVCASSMTKRALVHAGCSAEKITVVPYGAAASETSVAPRPAGPCRFLFVGQGIQRKGLHHLAAAWRQASLSDAELIVASYLIDPGIAALLDQPNVRLVGRQDREAIDSLFASADAFVMPSLVEGFGLVYLEALDAGCHVIGTTNTGLPDLQLGAAAATIVPVGDIEALAAALAQIADRKRSGELDPDAIQAEGARWTWADFRREIAAHARAMLGRPSENGR